MVSPALTVPVFRSTVMARVTPAHSSSSSSATPSSRSVARPCSSAAFALLSSSSSLLGAAHRRRRASSVSSTVRVFAATGLEGDVGGVNNTLTAVGQFVGVGLGVAGLGFIAGAQQMDGEKQKDAPSRAGAPAKSSSLPAAASAKGGGKQTIAGGVTGAKNPKKQFPGMPKKQKETDANDARILGNLLAGAAGGGGGATAPASASPGGSKKFVKNPAAAAATEAKKAGGGGGGGGLMSGLMSGLLGGGKTPLTESLATATGNYGGAAARKCSYTWGAAEAMGPREYMEDAWCVKDTGFVGGYFFASVMDGMAETKGLGTPQSPSPPVPRPRFFSF